MRLAKAMTALKIARSRSEAERLVKQGAVMVGACIQPCNSRMPPFVCTCDGWRKVTNPVEDIPAGQVLRIKDGNWRLLNRLDGNPGWDQIPGIGWVPEESASPAGS